MSCRPPLVGSNQLSQLHQQDENEQDRGEHGAHHSLKDGDGATLAANSLQQGIHGVAAEIGEGNEVNIPEDLPHLGRAEEVAKVLHRCRIDLAEVLGVVLAKQDGRRFGGILRLK